MFSRFRHCRLSTTLHASCGSAEIYITACNIKASSLLIEHLYLQLMQKRNSLENRVKTTLATFCTYDIKYSAHCQRVSVLKRNVISLTCRGWRPWSNHACRFCRQSVQGCGRGRGSKFRASHWLWLSPLQQACTTVHVQPVTCNTKSCA